MKDRLKNLRKTLGLTQQEFADRIGVNRGNIATYETRNGNPGTSVIALICREFNVNEDWLRTGEGEMFKQTEESAVSRLCAELRASDLEAGIIRAYFRIDPQIRESFMRHLLEEVQAEYTPGAPAREIVPAGYSSREDLEREADQFAAMAREQFLSEKLRASEASSANASDAG